MFSYRINNLRSLKDTGEVNLKPINILLGANSTGKSTFLRSFPLFKQSISSSTKGPVLWYGDFVDFGTFKDAINRDSKDSSIKFEFGFDNELFENYLFRRGRKSTDKSKVKNLNRIKVQISLSNSEASGGWRTYCSGLKFKLLYLSGSEDVIEFLIDEEQGLAVIVNGKSYGVKSRLFSQMRSFFPMFDAPYEDKYYELLDDKYMFPDIFVNSAKEALFYKAEKKETIVRLFDSLEITDSEGFLEIIKSFSHGGGVFNKKVDAISISDEGFVDLRNSWLANFASSILPDVDRLLRYIFSGINYSGPKRASVDRFYRLMDLQVNEIDHEGNNLAMFLSSLPQNQNRALKKWCRDNFDIEVDTKEINGNVSIFVSEKPYVNKENVTDMGFGYSQILPIIVSLWNKVRRNKFGMMYRAIPSIYVMEQPELHLHPKLQAKVASILIKTSLMAKRNGINLILIIETHSKEIVDRLSLVGSEVDEVKDLFQVVLFEKNNKNNTELKITELNEQGYLEEWPYGFFEPDSREVIDFIKAIK